MDHRCDFCEDAQSGDASPRLVTWLFEEYLKTLQGFNRTLSQLRNDELFHCIVLFCKSGYWGDCPRMNSSMNKVKIELLQEALQCIVNERYTTMIEDFARQHDSEDSRRSVESYRVFSEVLARICEPIDPRNLSNPKPYDLLRTIFVRLYAMSSASLDPSPMGAPDRFSPEAEPYLFLDGDLKKKVIDGPLNEECGICLSSLGEDFTIFDGCKHNFCYACIETNFRIRSNMSCPNCRQDVSSWTSTGLLKLLLQSLKSRFGI